jgi:hypothetical protein
MTDKNKLKALLKSRGLKYAKIAEITGFTPDYVKDALQPNKPVPRWCKLILYLHGCQQPNMHTSTHTRVISQNKKTF